MVGISGAVLVRRFEATGRALRVEAASARMAEVRGSVATFGQRGGSDRGVVLSWFSKGLRMLVDTSETLVDEYEVSEAEKYIKPFLKQLSREIPELKVVRVDERFTSKMAIQSILDAGLKKKARQNKALVDSVSATLILQSYLEMVK